MSDKKVGEVELENLNPNKDFEDLQARGEELLSKIRNLKDKLSGNTVPSDFTANLLVIITEYLAYQSLIANIDDQNQYFKDNYIEPFQTIIDETLKLFLNLIQNSQAELQNITFLLDTANHLSVAANSPQKIATLNEKIFAVSRPLKGKKEAELKKREENFNAIHQQRPEIINFLLQLQQGSIKSVFKESTQVRITELFDNLQSTIQAEQRLSEDKKLNLPKKIDKEYVKQKLKEIETKLNSNKCDIAAFDLFTTDKKVASIIKKSESLNEIYKTIYDKIINNICDTLKATSADLFNKITRDDILNYKFGSGEAPDFTNNLAVYNNYLDKISNYVIQSVVATVNNNEQCTLTIQRWITIADICYKQGNHFAFKAILSGLQNSSIYRLIFDTKANGELIYHNLGLGLSKTTQDKLIELIDTDTKDMNLAKGKNALKDDALGQKYSFEKMSPCIPFAGYYQNQIVLHKETFKNSFGKALTLIQEFLKKDSSVEQNKLLAKGYEKFIDDILKLKSLGENDIEKLDAFKDELNSKYALSSIKLTEIELDENCKKQLTALQKTDFPEGPMLTAFMDVQKRQELAAAVNDNPFVWLEVQINATELDPLLLNHADIKTHQLVKSTELKPSKLIKKIKINLTDISVDPKSLAKPVNVDKSSSLNAEQIAEEQEQFIANIVKTVSDQEGLVNKYLEAAVQYIGSLEAIDIKLDPSEIAKIESFQAQQFYSKEGVLAKIDQLLEKVSALQEKIYYTSSQQTTLAEQKTKLATYKEHVINVCKKLTLAQDIFNLSGLKKSDQILDHVAAQAANILNGVKTSKLILDNKAPLNELIDKDRSLFATICAYWRTFASKDAQQVIQIEDAYIKLSEHYLNSIAKDNAALSDPTTKTIYDSFLVVQYLGIIRQQHAIFEDHNASYEKRILATSTILKQYESIKAIFKILNFGAVNKENILLKLDEQIDRARQNYLSCLAGAVENYPSKADDAKPELKLIFEKLSRIRDGLTEINHVFQSVNYKKDTYADIAQLDLAELATEVKRSTHYTTLSQIERLSIYRLLSSQPADFMHKCSQAINYATSIHAELLQIEKNISNYAAGYANDPAYSSLNTIISNYKQLLESITSKNGQPTETWGLVSKLVVGQDILRMHREKTASVVASKSTEEIIQAEKNNLKQLHQKASELKNSVLKRILLKYPGMFGSNLEKVDEIIAALNKAQDSHEHAVETIKTILQNNNIELNAAEAEQLEQYQIVSDLINNINNTINNNHLSLDACQNNFNKIKDFKNKLKQAQEFLTVLKEQDAINDAASGEMERQLQEAEAKITHFPEQNINIIKEADEALLAYLTEYSASNSLDEYLLQLQSQILTSPHLTDFNGEIGNAQDNISLAKQAFIKLNNIIQGLSALPKNNQLKLKTLLLLKDYLQQEPELGLTTLTSIETYQNATTTLAEVNEKVSKHIQAMISLQDEAKAKQAAGKLTEAYKFNIDANSLQSILVKLREQELLGVKSKIILKDQILQIKDRKKTPIAGITGHSEETVNAFNLYVDWIETRLTAGDLQAAHILDELITTSWAINVLNHQDNSSLRTRVAIIESRIIHILTHDLMTLMQQAFLAIPEQELLDVDNMDDPKKAPNLAKYKLLTDKICYYVINDILANNTDINIVRERLTRWISVAHSAYENGNFSLAIFIYAALSNVAIERLINGEQNKLSLIKTFDEKTQQKLQALKDLANPAMPSAARSVTYQNYQGPYVPYVPSFMRDLVQSKEAAGKNVNLAETIAGRAVIKEMQAAKASFANISAHPITVIDLQAQLALVGIEASNSKVLDEQNLAASRALLPNNSLDDVFVKDKLIKLGSFNLANQIDSQLLEMILASGTDLHPDKVKGLINGLTERFEVGTIQDAVLTANINALFEKNNIKVASEITDAFQLRIQELIMDKIWQELAARGAKLPDDNQRIFVAGLERIKPGIISRITNPNNYSQALEEAKTPARIQQILIEIDRQKADTLAIITQLNNLAPKTADQLQQYIKFIEQAYDRLYFNVKWKSNTKSKDLQFVSKADNIQNTHAKNLLKIQNPILRNILATPELNNGYLTHPGIRIVITRLNNMIWSAATTSDRLGDLKEILADAEIYLTDQQIIDIDAENQRLRALVEVQCPLLKDYIKVQGNPDYNDKRLDLADKQLEVILSRLAGKSLFSMDEFQGTLLSSLDNTILWEAYLTANTLYFKNVIEELTNGHNKAVALGNLTAASKRQVKLKEVLAQINDVLAFTTKQRQSTTTEPLKNLQYLQNTLLQEQTETSQKLLLLNLGRSIKSDALFNAIRKNNLGLRLPDDLSESVLLELAGTLNSTITRAQFNQEDNVKLLHGLQAKGIGVDDENKFYQVIDNARKIHQEESSLAVKFATRLNAITNKITKDYSTIDESLIFSDEENADPKARTARDILFLQLSYLLKEIVDFSKLLGDSLEPSRGKLSADDLIPAFIAYLMELELKEEFFQAIKNLDEVIVLFTDKTSSRTYFNHNEKKIITDVMSFDYSGGIEAYTLITLYNASAYLKDIFDIKCETELLDSQVKKLQDIIDSTQLISAHDFTKVTNALSDLEQLLKVTDENLTKTAKLIAGLYNDNNRIDEFSKPVQEKLDKFTENLLKVKQDLMSKKEPLLKCLAEIQDSIKDIAYVTHLCSLDHANKWANEVLAKLAEASKDKSVKPEYDEGTNIERVMLSNDFTDPSSTALYGTNNQLQFKMFNENSYNNRNDGDYVERGFLMQRAFVAYVNSFESDYINSNDKAKLIDWATNARWERCKEKLQLLCSIPLTDEAVNNIAFKKRYRELMGKDLTEPCKPFQEWPSADQAKYFSLINPIAKKILQEYLSSLLISLKDVATINLDLNKLAKTIKDYETRIVARDNRSNFVNIGYKVGLNDTKMFNAQLVLGEDTAPSTSRRGNGPYNFVLEMIGSTTEDQKTQQESAEIWLAFYRGVATTLGKKGLERYSSDKANTKKLLSLIVKDQLNALPAELPLGTSIDNPLLMNINFHSLLSAFRGDPRGSKLHDRKGTKLDTNENNQLKTLIRALDFFRFQKQPIEIELTINGQEKIVYVNLDATVSNTIVKKIYGPRSQLQKKVEAEGFCTSNQHAEQYLRRLVFTSDKLDEVFAKLHQDSAGDNHYQLIVNAQNKLLDLYNNDPTVKKSEEHLHELIVKNKEQGLVGFYKKLTKIEEEYDSLDKKLANYEDRAKELEQQFVEITKKISTEKSAIYEAYVDVNKAKRAVWQSEAAQQTMGDLQRILPAALEEITLGLKDGRLKRDPTVTNLQDFCKLSQLYLESQEIFFTSAHKKYANYYELPTHYLLIDDLTKRKSIVNCKSVQDRSGFQALLLQAMLAFQRDFGYYPRFNNAKDKQTFCEEYLLPVVEFGVSEVNTQVNEPGARGLQIKAKFGGYDISEDLDNFLKIHNAGAGLAKKVFTNIKFKYTDVYVTDVEFTATLKEADNLLIAIAELINKGQGNPQQLKVFLGEYQKFILDTFKDSKNNDSEDVTENDAQKSFMAMLQARMSNTFSIPEVTNQSLSKPEQELYNKLQNALTKIKLQVSSTKSDSKGGENVVQYRYLLLQLRHKAEKLQFISQFKEPTIQAMLIAVNLIPGNEVEQNLDIIESYNSNQQRKTVDIVRQDFNNLGYTLSEKQAVAICGELNRLRVLQYGFSKNEQGKVKSTSLKELLLKQPRLDFRGENDLRELEDMFANTLISLSTINNYLLKHGAKPLSKDELRKIRLDYVLNNTDLDFSDLITKIEQKVPQLVQLNLATKRLSRFRNPLWRRLTNADIVTNINDLNALLLNAVNDLSGFYKEYKQFIRYDTPAYLSQQKAVHQYLISLNSHIVNACHYFANELNNMLEKLRKTQSAKIFTAICNQFEDILPTMKSMVDILATADLFKDNSELAAILVKLYPQTFSNVYQALLKERANLFLSRDLMNEAEIAGDIPLEDIVFSAAANSSNDFTIKPTGAEIKTAKQPALNYLDLLRERFSSIEPGEQVTLKKDPILPLKEKVTVIKPNNGDNNETIYIKPEKTKLGFDVNLTTGEINYRHPSQYVSEKDQEKIAERMVSMLKKIGFGARVDITVSNKEQYAVILEKVIHVLRHKHHFDDNIYVNGDLYKPNTSKSFKAFFATNRKKPGKLVEGDDDYEHDKDDVKQPLLKNH